MATARWQPEVRDRRYKKRRNLGLDRIVSEGDSWFDYPMYLNLIDRVDDLDRFAIKRFEVSGDTLGNMLTELPRVERTVIEENPKCILFSGGGNDLVDKHFIPTLFKDFDPALTARELINSDVWTAQLQILREGYEKVIATLAPHAPIIGHGYDHLIPSDSPVRYDGFRVTGPWVKPALDGHNIVDPDLQTEIGALIIDDFNDLISSVATDHPDDFIYVDLRGKLDPGDWQNEMHPTKDGFRKLRVPFVEAIDNELEDVIARRAAPPRAAEAGA